GGGDAISLGTDTANPNNLLVDFGNGTQPQVFDRTSFNKISVFLDRGDDTFQAPFDFSFVTPITVSGGAGNDTITGGEGNDSLSGDAGDDTIRGAGGDDVIFGNGGQDDVDGGRGNDTEVLGADDDTALWNPGEGSDTIDGGGGTDTLDFNGSNANETMTLAANGEQAVLVRDVAAIRMDLDRLEKVHVAAVGGTDSITVGDLTGTDVSAADVDLSGFGGGTGDSAADTVTVNGTNKADAIDVQAANSAVLLSGLHATTQITGSEVTNDKLQVNAGGGNDTVDVGNEVGTVIGVSVDLGTGQR
ncbi:MAG TPA: calcium-binding protein, partial [Jatrophihabitans sp.]|nr:calcium-binding protein [Jatrophihabitans sp.]